MAKFKRIKTLHKFAAVHASIYNHFNHGRYRNHRAIFNQHRAAALAVWRQCEAWQPSTVGLTGPIQPV